MVFTAAQMTSFFENADQMEVQHATVVQLVTEFQPQRALSNPNPNG